MKPMLVKKWATAKTLFREHLKRIGDVAKDTAKEIQADCGQVINCLSFDFDGVAQVNIFTQYGDKALVSFLHTDDHWPYTLSQVETWLSKLAKITDADAESLTLRQLENEESIRL